MSSTDESHSAINDISRHEKLFRKTNLNFSDCNTFDEFNLGAVNIACQ